MDPSNQPTNPTPTSTPIVDETAVIQYLSQMGFKQTESMFRQEASRIHSSNEQQYTSSDVSTMYPSNYRLIKPEEYKQILYPIFVHEYLEMITKDLHEYASEFFNTYQSDHIIHEKELKTLRVITHPHHVNENELAQKFRSKKFTVKMSQTSLDILIDLLQNNSLLLRIVNQNIKIDKIEDIGFPGFDTEELEEFNKQEVQLGPLPIEPSFRDEVEKKLSEEDRKIIEAAESQVVSANGIPKQFTSLQQEFNEKIRREQQNSDVPDRASIPLPSYKGADVHSQIEIIKDMTQRIELGPSSLPSVCFYSFHNTHDSLNCLSISEDSSLIAGGFSDSYVKIWSLKDEKLRGLKSQIKPSEINSVYDLENARESPGSVYKKLLGHSGPVFGLSFSPDNRYLVSCSADSTARLWSTDTFTNLVCFKGHNSPVWDVEFSPMGFYFVTAGHDRTARIWSCDHIFPLRIFVGHMSDVDCVKFHPNTKYIVTGSSDKSIRMWDIQRGSCFRILSGHTGSICCLAISSDGRLLASGGDDEMIILWDLGTGKLIKKMTGHTDFINSLAFSKGDNLLVSGGADNTVRIWDVKKCYSNDLLNDGWGKSENVNPINTSMSSSLSSIKQLKSKSTASPDLLKTLPTKKSPVYKIHFTGRNLCLAAGSFTSSEEEKLYYEQMIKQMNKQKENKQQDNDKETEKKNYHEFEFKIILLHLIFFLL
ncbi:6356_t:CDS:10 [Diversispora eburnea]|uniref:6356_t:CDS:1 n=1 Tax=Diversispora eburnea TaxID=1213867 RepID=A0A9N9AZL3_9GLOM|nr:6356_t:CDS:10 [Diversispora eburnea]